MSKWLPGIILFLVLGILLAIIGYSAKCPK